MSGRELQPFYRMGRPSVGFADISPTRGESGSPALRRGFAMPTSERDVGGSPPSPRVGEMSGRTEGVPHDGQQPKSHCPLSATHTRPAATPHSIRSRYSCDGSQQLSRLPKMR
jgi:hypothetical protein